MTPLEIIKEWEHGCGNTVGGKPSECDVCTDAMVAALKPKLEAYLREAVLAERERCAAICKAKATRWGSRNDDAYNAIYEECAEAIRAQPKP